MLLLMLSFPGIAAAASHQGCPRAPAGCRQGIPEEGNLLKIFKSLIMFTLWVKRAARGL
jgi:hypothetical protein